MRSRGFRVFLAVALGSFVGALVALEVRTAFWWIGLIVGGLTGYLGYQPMTVARAVPIAAREATKLTGLTVGYFWTRRQFIGWALLSYLVLTFWATLFVAVIGAPKTMDSIRNALLTSMFGAGIAGPFAFFLSRVFLIEGFATEKMRSFCRKGNPIRVLAVQLPRVLWKILWSLPIVTVQMIIGTPRVVVVLYRALVLFPIRFAITLTRLIHSDVRLLCGVDAAIGAGIGYFTANALLGALAGGIFGVLNFEVLSKRVLKIVPSKTS